MTVYQLWPYVTFLLGVLFGWLFFRERLQRLRCQRNLAEYRADEAAGKTARAEQERDCVAALAVSLQEGATYSPVPFLRSVPKQAER